GPVPEPAPHHRAPTRDAAAHRQARLAPVGEEAPDEQGGLPREHQPDEGGRLGAGEPADDDVGPRAGEPAEGVDDVLQHDGAAPSATLAAQGRSTAWVWVTFATRRPASSNRSVSTTITVRPTWRGRATASTWPSRTARRKLVFDSIVVVPAAPSGRLRNAAMPPTVSASPMSAPPWSAPPVVQRDGSHASRARTSSAWP